MSRKKQDSQGELKTARKITPGKILALVIAAAVIIYLSFSVHVFYNFIRLMITNPDSGKSEVSSLQLYESAAVSPAADLSDFMPEESF